MAGLDKCSLSLTRDAHPALTSVFDLSVVPGDDLTLQKALTQQSAPVALATSHALQQTFSDLRIKLIGQSLTDRLLSPLLDNPSSNGDAVQDTSP